MSKYRSDFYQRFEYANYAHVFLYAFYRRFEAKMREVGKIGRIDYLLDAKIDGNVIHLQFKTDDKKIYEIFAILMNEHEFNDEEIKDAVMIVGLSMSRTAEITNMAKLREAIQEGEQSEKALKATEDSLSSPALGYNEKIDLKNDIVDFELLAEGKDAKSILDYYVSAVAQQLSDIWPESLVRAENEKNRVVILNEGKEINVANGIGLAIERLKGVGFDKRMAVFLGINTGEVRKVLPEIIISL